MYEEADEWIDGEQQARREEGCKKLTSSSSLVREGKCLLVHMACSKLCGGSGRKSRRSKDSAEAYFLTLRIFPADISDTALVNIIAD